MIATLIIYLIVLSYSSQVLLLQPLQGLLWVAPVGQRLFRLCQRHLENELFMEQQNCSPPLHSFHNLESLQRYEIS